MSMRHDEDLPYKALCNFMVNPAMDYETLKENVERLLIHPNIRGRINQIVGLMPFFRLDQTKLSKALSADKNNNPVDPRSLRQRLMFLLGYHQNEANLLMKFVGNVFSGSGNLNQFKHLVWNEALVASAFLETSPNMLQREVKDDQWASGRPEDPWFYYLPTETDLRNVLQSISSASKQSDLFYPQAMTLQAGLPPVGVCWTHLPDMMELTVWVDRGTNMSGLITQDALIKMGETIGISGPAVYSESSPFLSSGKQQIHRITWPKSIRYRTKFRLYCRVLSQRTPMLSLIQGPHTDKILFPFMDTLTTEGKMESKIWVPVSLAGPSEERQD